MIKKRKIITVIFCLTLLAALITFTFLDLEFSQAVFNMDSVYGKLFEAAGEIPCMAVAAFCGLLLLKTRNREKFWKNLLGFVGFGLIFLSGAFTAAFLPIKYFNISPLWVLPIAPILCAAMILFARLADTRDRKKVIRVALIGLFTILCALIIVNVLKICWNRPRFRDMAFAGNFDEFRIWLVPGGKGSLLPDTFGKGQAYASFPSGHVANASVILWIALLPSIMPKLKNAGAFLSVFAAAWIVLTAVSRVVMGAHFMTDTIVAFVIVSASFTLLCKKLKQKGRADGDARA